MDGVRARKMILIQIIPSGILCGAEARSDVALLCSVFEVKLFKPLQASTF